MRRWIALVLVPLLSVGCDGGGLETPEPEPGVTVFAPAAAEIAPDAVTRVDLLATFTGTDASTDRFRVESVSGPVAASLDGETALVLEPTASGEAEVVVVRLAGTARDAEAWYGFTVPEPAPLPSPDPVDVEGGADTFLDLTPWLPEGIDASADLRLVGGEGPAELYLQHDGRLRIAAAPLAEAGEVTLRLETTRFVPRPLDVTVRVVPQCPEPPDGTADYFPLRAGDVWAFDLTYESLSFFPDSGIRRAGVRTWTATEETCAGRVRTITVTTAFEGDEERLVTTNGTSEWVDQGEVSLASQLRVTEDPTGRLDFYEDLTGDGVAATLDRYLPASWPEVVDADPYVTLTVRRGVGLERLAGRQNRPHRVSVMFDLARR